MSTRREITVSGGFLLLAAWFAACSGWRMTLLVLAAAAVHEAGHLAVLRLIRVPVRSFRLGALGAVLAVDPASATYGEELLAVLAGPLANFLAAALLAAAGKTAAAGAQGVLGAFNLLPIRPLDGGRALFLLLSLLFGPSAAERGSRLAGAVCALALFLALLTVTVRSGGTLWLLPAAAGALSALVREVFPAKLNFSRFFVK